MEQEQQLQALQDISPFVRIVKISNQNRLVGEWIDYDHVFTFIEQGTAQFILDGKQLELNAGDAILMTPFMLHFIRSTSSVPLIQYIVHFDVYSSEIRKQWTERGIRTDDQYHLPEKEATLIGIHPVSHIQEVDRLYIKRRFLKLINTYQMRQPFSDLQMKAILLEILSIFFRNQVQKNVSDNKKTKSWNVIERSIYFIYEQYNNISLDRNMIAHHANISPNHLSFLFKDQLNVPLHKFISYVRIEKAKQLMLNDQNTLTHIAQTVGYSSIYSFSRSFKSITGITASQFIHMHSTKPIKGD